MPIKDRGFEEISQIVFKKNCHCLETILVIMLVSGF